MAGLLVCLFQYWTTAPTPSSITVSSTLVLKPVCSSSGCKSFQALVVPLFSHLSLLSSPFPPSSYALNCCFYNLYHPAVVLGNWERQGVHKRKEREHKVYLCLLPDSFLSSLLVSAAFIVWKWRPLWMLLNPARADIFLFLWNVHSVCQPWKMEYSTLPHIINSTFERLSNICKTCLKIFEWCLFQVTAVAFAGSVLAFKLLTSTLKERKCLKTLSLKISQD